ncbi:MULTISPECIES: DUF6968 family protein [Sorangium]|uniref:DUF6968 domain-containing protein n=1 Tax=Sorangium cellulosum TaxID=56 RepID=A0A4P2QQ37_SORCE|nr:MULTISPECIES: hypothetical protein [Sorangium]AUX32078.1 uncharacterized protein SOCE836_042140 [Sorangium cellulosum]WCQ91449.1 hypothetical protein NQZ70_04168 [Sorangium sp. Soce836]
MDMHMSPRVLIRTLQMALGGSDVVCDIVVRIALPERDPVTGGDFRVLVEIGGFDEPYSRHVHGVDELQAFLAGCWLVPQILNALAPPGARLTWLGEDDLGFGASPAAAIPA